MGRVCRSGSEVHDNIQGPSEVSGGPSLTAEDGNVTSEGPSTLSISDWFNPRGEAGDGWVGVL